MPTYLYECPICGEFEHEHSIKENLEFCPKCELKAEGDLTINGRRTFQKVKRLIASGGSFVLEGSGWARDNYSK
jgi:putative FmdB family regulatory protein